MSKQTAVEWLVQEISSDRVGQAIIKTFLKEFEQAKAMEKENIVDAYDAGLFDGTMDEPKDRIYTKYYTQTYGGDK
jgi:hypothetical protein